MNEDHWNLIICQFLVNYFQCPNDEFIIIHFFNFSLNQFHLAFVVESERRLHEQDFALLKSIIFFWY